MSSAEWYGLRGGFDHRCQSTGERKPMTRPVFGPLFCTRGQHWAPRQKFNWRAPGRRHSWCIDCKRAYDRAQVEEKRRSARMTSDRRRAA
jgi:hypothetical protein